MAQKRKSAGMQVFEIPNPRMYVNDAFERELSLLLQRSINPMQRGKKIVRTRASIGSCASSTVSHPELVRCIASDTSLSLKSAQAMLDALVKALRRSVTTGGRVEIRGLGTIERHGNAGQMTIQLEG